MADWITVVDDDAQNLRIASHILTSAGKRVSCLRSGEELVSFAAANKPDLILLDVHMTGIDGFETLTRFREIPGTERIPVIFLTADEEAVTETRGLAAGAMDFIKKPFVPEVLLQRVDNTLELIRLQTDLTTEVEKKTTELHAEHEKTERLMMQIVMALSSAVDEKDTYTNGHSTRVAHYSQEIARRAGMTGKALDDIFMIGLLHDVGKIGIQDSIINKPAKLTEDEYLAIQNHPVMGARILRNITEFPKLAIGARWHHERYDGSGYPDGLAGEEIPEEARIIAVADAYDAMSSRRSYRSPMPQEAIRAEFERGRGSQFDPRFADIMLQMISEDTAYEMKEI